MLISGQIGRDQFGTLFTMDEVYFNNPVDYLQTCRNPEGYYNMKIVLGDMIFVWEPTLRVSEILSKRH